MAKGRHKRSSLPTEGEGMPPEGPDGIPVWTPERLEQKDRGQPLFFLPAVFASVIRSFAFSADRRLMLTAPFRLPLRSACYLQLLAGMNFLQVSSAFCLPQLSDEIPLQGSGTHQEAGRSDQKNTGCDGHRQLETLGVGVSAHRVVSH